MGWSVRSGCHQICVLEAHAALAVPGPGGFGEIRDRLRESVSGSGGGVRAQRLVRFAGRPETMHQHRQLACNCDARSSSVSFAASTSDPVSVAFEVTVRCRWLEDVGCRRDQHRAHASIAFLADTEMRIALPRLSALARQTE